MNERNAWVIISYICLCLFAIASGIVGVLGIPASIILASLLGGVVLAVVLSEWKGIGWQLGVSFSISMSVSGLMYHGGMIPGIVPALFGTFFVSIVIVKSLNGSQWYHQLAGVSIGLFVASLLHLAHDAEKREKVEKEEKRKQDRIERCERPLIGRIAKIIGKCDEN